MLSDERMAPRLPFEAPSPDLRMSSANFGIAIAARMPMMATTIISSMRVKPDFVDFFICATPFMPIIRSICPERVAVHEM